MEREITITVTDEEARRIEEQAAIAGYESVADYVHSAISTALAEHSFEIPETVLLQILEEDEADTDSGVPADEAFAQVRANLKARYGKG